MPEEQKLYTPPPIKGYRKLTQAEVDLTNEIKEHGEKTAALIAKVQAHVEKVNLRITEDEMQAEEGSEAVAKARDERNEFLKAEPFRWIAMARTSLQIGQMELTRAVTRPPNF